MIIVVETLDSAVRGSIRFCIRNVMDGLIQQICSQPARTGPATQSAARRVSLLEFQRWLNIFSQLFCYYSLLFFFQYYFLNYFYKVCMNDLPGARLSDCDICPDPDSDNARAIAPLGAQWPSSRITQH